MKTKNSFITFIILICFSVLISCSKKSGVVDLKYTVEDLANTLHETSLGSDKAEDALKISDYSPGVNRLESKSLVYKRLTFYAVSFESSELARKEAIRLNQYYSRNWLFDRVEGEPLLEDYLIEKFKAINPNRTIQRVPKKHVESHGETSGEGHGEQAPSAGPGTHH
jgi:hypothetical protein